MKKNRRPVELLLTSLGLVACLALSSLAVEANQRAESSDQDILLHVETPDFRLDGGGLSVPDYGVNAVPGAPALPVWSTLVTLPPDGEWSLSFQSQGERSLQAKGAIPAVPVPSLDLNGPINWLDRTDLPAEVPLKDAPDPDIYQRSAFYPETAVVAGPVQWQRGQRLLPVRVFPFQLNPVTGELLYRPDLTVTIHVEAGEPKAAQAPADPSSNTPEEIDGALRINTGDRGLYRLTHADLQAAGVPLATTDPDTFALFYLGEPVDIQVVGGDDGHFDPGDLVIFYAEPYQGRYMTHNVYRFTYGGSTNGDRMESRAVTPTGNEPLVTTATQTVHVEFDRDYRSVYNLPSDADHWFDTVLFANVVNPTVTRTYDLDAVSAFQVASGDAELRVALHGGTAQVPNPDQSVRVSLNGHQADTFQWDGQTSYLAVATVPTTWLDGAPNQVHLTAALDQLSDITSYWVSPNWVELSFPAQAEAVNDRLYMEAIPVTGRRAQVRVSGFSSPDVRVYDVRDARQPVQLLTLQTGNTGGQVTVDFWDAWPAGAAPPSYTLAATNALLAPLSIEEDAPSKWKSPLNQADYIAIVHPLLWDAVEPLLDYRAAEGFRVKKVSVQDIYDEFSSGRVDPEAIRTFLTYAYHHWNGGQEPPAYVLLVGDGHYDFKNAAGTNLPNLIPPYLIQIDPWLGETGADNRYVSVDGPNDYLPDMHVGRIPAKTPADVTTVIDKIMDYEQSTPGGDWQNRAVFVADDYEDDAGNFHALSDDVRLHWLPDTYDSQPIYYRMDPAHDTGAEMRSAIKAAFNQGAVYLQWFGHASQFRWGSVSMLDILDPPALVANGKLPFSAHLGCWSGYFLGIQGSPIYGNNEQSLGEVLLLTPGRGSVADLSPSGLHVGGALQNIDRGLIRAMFQDHVLRVGAVVDAAKLFFYDNSNSYHDIIDTSVLFADPALKLRVAQHFDGSLFLPWVAAGSN